MIETIVKEVDDLKFSIQQFPAMTALKLEKRTLTILAPMAEILSDVKSAESELDLGKIGLIFQKVLLNLDDNTFEKYIADMLSSTYVHLTRNDGSDTKPISLNDKDIFNSTFAGKNMTMFKLLIEVMRVNRFAFFGLLDGKGFLTNI